MTTIEMISKVEELKELEALIKTAEKEVEALKDEIKRELTEKNTDEVTVGRYTIRWTKVESDRFDSTRFKSAMPDIYDMYIKHTHSKRFSIVG